MKKWVFALFLLFVLVGTIYLVGAIQSPQISYAPLAVEVPLAPTTQPLPNGFVEEAQASEQNM